MIRGGLGSQSGVEKRRRLSNYGSQGYISDVEDSGEESRKNGNAIGSQIEAGEWQTMDVPIYGYESDNERWKVSCRKPPLPPRLAKQAVTFIDVEEIEDETDEPNHGFYDYDVTERAAVGGHAVPLGDLDLVDQYVSSSSSLSAPSLPDQDTLPKTEINDEENGSGDLQGSGPQVDGKATGRKSNNGWLYKGSGGSNILLTSVWKWSLAVFRKLHWRSTLSLLKKASKNKKQKRQSKHQ